MRLIHVRRLATGALLLSLALAAQAAPVLKPGARVGIAGDSITEQKLYSRFIDVYLTVCAPQVQAHCFQFGRGGESAAGFLLRMTNDLAVFQPTVVTTCYGMNDGAYRVYDAPMGEGYERAMRSLITKLKQNGVSVVVGGPGVVDTKYFTRSVTAPVYNETLGRLSAIAQKLANEEGVPFANVHDAMMTAMTKSKAALGENYEIASDGIHPSPNGHLVMAYAFLKALGMDGQIGTITVDMDGAATGSEGHKIVSSANGKVEIESTRYPFCFSGNEKSGTISMLPFVPFNEELNRLTLMVKNLKSARAKVTWGTVSKSFSREQLAQGINLAAEFLQNPFYNAFENVSGAVGSKQNFEQFLIWNAPPVFKDIQTNLGNDAEANAAMDLLRRKLQAHHVALEVAAVAKVVPVRHSLVIQGE